MQSANIKITPYLFEGEGLVRVVERDGRPWFVAKDIATALGYKDTAKAVSTHCKHGVPVGVGDSPTPSGLDPQTIIVPEGDMYRLILRSHLPAAERFERWVMDEVLPSIRKTGRYQSQGADADLDDIEVQTADSFKLKMVTEARHIFGERAAAQLWIEFKLKTTPAMIATAQQMSLFEFQTTMTRVINGGAR